MKIAEKTVHQEQEWGWKAVTVYKLKMQTTQSFKTFQEKTEITKPGTVGSVMTLR